MPDVLEIAQKNFGKIVKTATRLIQQGKVIVCPTDTVYGLMADATNRQAIRKLFKIKKRQKNKPVPIFVKDLKMAKEFAKIDAKQERFLKSAWPGKITAVLKRKQTKTKLYGVDKKTIGLRIPRYGLVNELLQKTNKPLSGTSANISGEPASTRIKEVIKQFTPVRDKSLTGFKEQKWQPDLIIDAGNLKSSRPSGIVDLTGIEPKILRK